MAKAGVYTITGSARDDRAEGFSEFPCEGTIELRDNGMVSGILNEGENGIFGGASLIVDGSWQKDGDLSFEVRHRDARLFSSRGSSIILI